MYNSGIEFFSFENFIPVAQKIINLNYLLTDFLGLCKTILGKKIWSKENEKKEKKKAFNTRKDLRTRHRNYLNMQILCLSTIYHATYTKIKLRI